MFPRVMVMTGQQCLCLRPLAWIGRKLPAQPPRPVQVPKTSTGRYSRLGGCNVQGCWQAAGCQQTSLGHLPPFRRRNKGCGHLPTRPSKEEETTGDNGAGWLLRASEDRITDHCNAEDKRQRGRAPSPGAGTGHGKRPDGAHSARGAGADEETHLHHIIPCFQPVSICNLDASLQFILITVVF